MPRRDGVDVVDCGIAHFSILLTGRDLRPLEDTDRVLPFLGQEAAEILDHDLDRRNVLSVHGNHGTFVLRLCRSRARYERGRYLGQHFDLVEKRDCHHHRFYISPVRLRRKGRLQRWERKIRVMRSVLPGWREHRERASRLRRLSTQAICPLWRGRIWRIRAAIPITTISVVDAISIETATFGFGRPSAILLRIAVTGSPMIHASVQLPRARGANGIFRPAGRQSARRSGARVRRSSTRGRLCTCRERRVRGRREIHDTSTTSITDCSSRRIVAYAGTRRAAGTPIPSISTRLIAVVRILLLMSGFLFLLTMVRPYSPRAIMSKYAGLPLRELSIRS